jgi:hypothetical protein
MGSPAEAEARVSTARVSRTRNLEYIMLIMWKETALSYLYCVKVIRPNLNPQRHQHTSDCKWTDTRLIEIKSSSTG